jgi:hypothetical protein
MPNNEAFHAHWGEFLTSDLEVPLFAFAFASSNGITVWKVLNFIVTVSLH